MSKSILRQSVMFTVLALAIGAAVSFVGGQTPAAAPSPAEPPVPRAELTNDWKPLFNGKNLDGYYTFFDKSGKGKDPKGIFKFEDGMLHIMDLPLPAPPKRPSAAATPEETGYLSTEKGMKWRSF